MRFSNGCMVMVVRGCTLGVYSSPPLLYAVQYSCNFLDHCVLLTLCYKSSFQRNNVLAFYSEVRCTVVMNWQLHTKKW